MLYVILALVIITTAVLWNAISRVYAAVTSRLETLHQKLESLENLFDRKLHKLQESADQIEYRTLTTAEKEHRKFQQARRLALSDVEQFKEGQTVTLISRSYYYPSENPTVDTFQYKHGRLGAPVESEQGSESTERAKSYICVHGFVRYEFTQEWKPYTFHATDDECVTTSHAGTIRRI